LDFKNRKRYYYYRYERKPGKEPFWTSIYNKVIKIININKMTEDSDKIYLLQHPGSCTGMFWRGNPETGSAPPSNDNWPRNGSLLKGVPITVKGEEYLKVSSFQQAGSSEFVSVEEGTYMLFYQGGLLLHLQ
jgi:hypothetical protein